MQPAALHYFTSKFRTTKNKSWTVLFSSNTFSLSRGRARTLSADRLTFHLLVDKHPPNPNQYRAHNALCLPSHREQNPDARHKKISNQHRLQLITQNREHLMMNSHPERQRAARLLRSDLESASLSPLFYLLCRRRRRSAFLAALPSAPPSARRVVTPERC